MHRKDLEIKHQDTDCMVIACPQCNSEIWLVYDEDLARYNDNIGNLHEGVQNYNWIVCENDKCKFANSVELVAIK
jgi:uncharacterized protein YbaR (Trm112 family)